MLVRRYNQNKAASTPPSSRVSQSAFDYTTLEVDILQETMGKRLYIFMCLNQINVFVQMSPVGRVAEYTIVKPNRCISFQLMQVSFPQNSLSSELNAPTTNSYGIIIKKK